MSTYLGPEVAAELTACNEFILPSATRRVNIDSDHVPLMSLRFLGLALTLTLYLTLTLTLTPTLILTPNPVANPEPKPNPVAIPL